MTDKLTIGSGCTFWHEGGRGESRWVVGWRFGFIREIPEKGKHAGQIRIEIPVELWERDPLTDKYKALPRLSVWIAAHNVNEPGDFIYHGPRAFEVIQERKEEKAAQQAKVEKLNAKSRRFHR